MFNGSVSKPLTAMFQKGSVLVIIVALCIYFSRLLLLTGNPYPVLASLGCMNIIFVVLLSILLKGGKVGVMALIYATIVAGCVHCLALGFLSLQDSAYAVGVDSRVCDALDYLTFGRTAVSVCRKSMYTAFGKFGNSDSIPCNCMVYLLGSTCDDSFL